MDVRVISTSGAITLEWTPGETTIDNTQVVPDPLIAAAGKALAGLRLRLNLSEDGELIGLANESEVAPKLQAAVDMIVREVTTRLPEDQRERFQSVMTSIMSPTMLIASITNDAQTYFGLNGITISVGESVEAPIEQPSPLGGGQIPANFRVEAESATNDSAVLLTTTTYDQAAFREIIRELAAKAGKPVTQEALDKVPPMKMADDGRFVFDRSVGLMREVIVKRRVTAGPAERLDAWEIRLLKGPTR